MFLKSLISRRFDPNDERACSTTHEKRSGPNLLMSSIRLMLFTRRWERRQRTLRLGNHYSRLRAHKFHLWEVLLDFVKDEHGTAAILNTGGMDDNPQRQPFDISQHMNFMTFHHLSCVATQFSARTPGMRTNSFILFVTTIKPSLRAWAPICMSWGPHGLPTRSNSARICP